MGSPIRYHEFRRLFEKFGVTVEMAGGSHIKMRKVVNGETRIYVAVVHRNQVLDVYVKAARRAFDLTPEFGISDRVFFK